VILVVSIPYTYGLFKQKENNIEKDYSLFYYYIMQAIVVLLATSTCVIDKNPIFDLIAVFAVCFYYGYRIYTSPEQEDAN